MANNRMYLQCKECKKGVAFSKFYPTGSFIGGDGAGWYTISNTSEKLDKFFDEHQHEFDKSSFGGYQYELIYEVPY